MMWWKGTMQKAQEESDRENSIMGKAFGTCGPREFLKARNSIPLRSNKRSFQRTALQIRSKMVLTFCSILLLT